MKEHIDKDIITEIAKEMGLDEHIVYQAVNSQFLLIRYVMQNESNKSVKLPFLGKFIPMKKKKNNE
jgi:nucleoid DNA-binding protein